MSQTQNTGSAAVPLDAAAEATRAPEVITFPKGLPGFETCRAFVLIAPEGETIVQCLRSVEGPAASFLVIDPRRAMAGYRCELSNADRERLQASTDGPLLWLSLVTLEENGTIVVNLRAPVVINPATMLGAQVIPHHCLYPLRHVLVPAE
jgi:flagellar assembly factor FliW